MSGEKEPVGNINDPQGHELSPRQKIINYINEAPLLRLQAFDYYIDRKDPNCSGQRIKTINHQLDTKSQLRKEYGRIHIVALDVYNRCGDGSPENAEKQMRKFVKRLKNIKKVLEKENKQPPEAGSQGTESITRVLPRMIESSIRGTEVILYQKSAQD